MLSAATKQSFLQKKRSFCQGFTVLFVFLLLFTYSLFLDEAEIYALNNFHEPTSYSFFHLITQLVYSHAQKAPTPRPETEWTIFLNEQNFLIPENLQPLLQDFDSTRSIVFGRLTHSK